MNYYKAKVVYEYYGEPDTDNMLVAASTYSEAVSAIEKYYESCLFEVHIELLSTRFALTEKELQNLFNESKGES